MTRMPSSAPDILPRRNRWHDVAGEGAHRAPHRLADEVLVADAHFGIRQSLDSKILPEIAIGKVAAAKMILPIAIGVDLIDKDREPGPTSAQAAPST
jgi:hypothetical protein